MYAPSGPVRLIETRRIGDARGWFTESYSARDFAALGITCRFVQDNHSRSHPAYTLRGLHFQMPPHAQEKLIRCIRGSIFDVAVDLRVGSPTFGRWVSATLSAENGRQLFAPMGFAHGFLTLEPDCEVAYKCSALYERAADTGVAWNDPDLAIAWPLPPGRAPELSPKDADLRPLAEFNSPFPYDGVPLTPLPEIAERP